MEMASYTSNIQPYGYTGGTKIASDGEDAKNVVTNITDKAVPAADATKSGPTQVTQVKEEKPTEKIPENKLVEKIVEKRIELNKKELEKMVEEMDHFVNSINTGLSFRIDEELGRDVVTIYEASTGDVIRQIPDEEMLVVLRRLAARSSGFVEEKV